ncbi:MAG: rod shape-determining protein MreC [Patescibacteria group bacterium]
MSFLLDKKIKRNKFLKIIFVVIFLLFLFYFRFSFFNKLSYTTHFIFQPVLVFGNHLNYKILNLSFFFQSKKNLLLENQNLKSELGVTAGKLLNHNSILDENLKLKEILNRATSVNSKILDRSVRAEFLGTPKNSATDSVILATILAKNDQSFYNTLIVDIGLDKGITEGDLVFALGNIPIGKISSVYKNSSKVILFSSPGEEIEGIISGKDILVTLVGRGGGNFEITLPRDFVVENKTEVALPGIFPYVVAIVESKISDPRDSFQKLLLISPVNIHQIKFLQVQKK